MNALAADLCAEDDALVALCAGLSPAQWQLRTAFHGWTPWDEVAHLCLLDGAAGAAVRGAEAFAAVAVSLRERRAAGAEISAIARAELGHLDGAALLAHWRAVYLDLSRALAACDAGDRLPWFGPPMSARSFATARLMETWAHGQDVFDALRTVRPATVRLRHIATLGVNTFGWSFSNRGAAVPQPAPHVVLRAPDGSTWCWNAPSQTDRVEGSALDFCLVVTQRRHVDDSGLTHRGTATAWMHVAQCFAGAPADGPAPGTRRAVA